MRIGLGVLRSVRLISLVVNSFLDSIPGTSSTPAAPDSAKISQVLLWSPSGPLQAPEHELMPRLAGSAEHCRFASLTCSSIKAQLDAAMEDLDTMLDNMSPIRNGDI